MADGDEELFRYLEKEFAGDRAVTILKELRAIFRKYMTEQGSKSSEEKIAAVLEMQPDLDPTTAALMANIYVAADGIMTALAIHLARGEASTR
jgi:hypothetical protein